MDSIIKEYIKNEKRKSGLNLKASEEFKKVYKVIKSCVTMKQLESARNMCDLYQKKWKGIMNVTRIIHTLLKIQKDECV